MASDRKIAANRENAQKSTGPRTSCGKAASRRNALRHGVLSSVAIADHDDRELFDELLSTLDAEFGPATPLEQMLVEKIAVTLWRNRRLLEAESAAISLRRLPRSIAGDVSIAVTGFDRRAVAECELEGDAAESIGSCEALLDEMPENEGTTLQQLEVEAATIHNLIVYEASQEDLSVVDYLARDHDGDLDIYLNNLEARCEEALRRAEAKQKLQMMAESAVKRAAVPSLADAQLAARYRRYSTISSSKRSLRCARRRKTGSRRSSRWRTPPTDRRLPVRIFRRCEAEVVAACPDWRVWMFSRRAPLWMLGSGRPIAD